MDSYAQGLKDRAQARFERNRGIQAEREYWEDRDRLILESPDEVGTDFWCDACGKDRTALGVKTVLQWGNERSAVYKSVGTCHPLRRWITDKVYDPYFAKSRSLKVQRREQAKDLIQPGEEMYSLLYP